MKQLQGVYDAYIPMKDAFVATDAKEVRKTARQVKSSLKNVDMGLLEGDAHMVWMKQLEILDSEISSISNGAGYLKPKNCLRIIQ